MKQVEIVSLFDPEDGASTFLRNIAVILADCTALHPRIYSSFNFYVVTLVYFSFVPNYFLCPSQWPRGLRHEPSSPDQTLGSRVRIPLQAWMSICVDSVFVF
jgi:hypothetical protein